MFTHDWFHRGGLERLQQAARHRCAAHKFPDGSKSPDYMDYLSQLETRTIVYLKDGLTYEISEVIDLDTTSGLVFQCVPVDESYRVGAIVIVTPYEDIARVEVFAVHPQDKPQESFRIPGFGGGVEHARE